MDEEYKYKSDEVTTKEDADYDALYLGNQNAYILMNALDRIEKLEKEITQLKKKSEFNVYDAFNDMTSDDDIKALI